MIWLVVIPKNIPESISHLGASCICLNTHDGTISESLIIFIRSRRGFFFFFFLKIENACPWNYIPFYGREVNFLN